MTTATNVGYRHSARFIQPFVKVLRRYEAVPKRELESLADVDVDAWVPYSYSARFCEWAITVTQDADLGLHAAEAVEPGDFDVVEYAGRSSDNVGEAIEIVNRYIGLLREGACFRLEQRGEICRWNLDMAIPTPRVVNDWTVAVYIVLARRVTGLDWRPLEVHVTHSEPHDTSEYRRIIGAPMKFGQRENALVFPKDFLQTPIREADERLHALMRRYAGDLLRQKPRTESFLQRVRAATAEQLGRGQPATARLARRLHMSERTLRRRLQEEGTSYKEILDDVRRELATNYLLQPELGVAEIAFMLGFSQTPAFSRAFKRWTGTTPIEYRAGLRLASAS